MHDGMKGHGCNLVNVTTDQLHASNTASSSSVIFRKCECTMLQLAYANNANHKIRKQCILAVV